MKRTIPVKSASASIDAKINELGDWRGKTLAKVRAIIHKADPEIVEEWKWMGTPVFSHGGIVCTGETYKNVVKMTFAKGAALKDPSGLFNSSLEGNVRRAIDIHEGDKVDEAALKNLIRAVPGFPPQRGWDASKVTLIHRRNIAHSYDTEHDCRCEAGTSGAASRSDGCDSLGQSRRDSAPLLAWIGFRVAQQHLDAHVIGAGRTMLGDPAQDCLLVAPRDDRVE